MNAPIKIIRRGAGDVFLTSGGFTVNVFTNDCGLVVRLTSDEQRPGETPLDEMLRRWDKKTA
jgi:hypothetical protein